MFSVKNTIAWFVALFQSIWDSNDALWDDMSVPWDGISDHGWNNKNNSDWYNES